ncbi:MAG: pseudouridine synthase [Thermoprotei archaeon]|mgnify:CR=1 FL=1|nr:MAG: pseudouridine synthase [Thermoprotei archaeon]RLE90193.1 MAG: pseudouridine synthase [Thermoprotei archaeon]
MSLSKPSLLELEEIESKLNYQYGNALGSKIIERFSGKISIKKSKRTRRIREIYVDNKLVFTLRATDGYLIPTLAGGELIKRLIPPPFLRIVIDPVAVDFVARGRSVFPKYVRSIDQNLRAGDEVIVVDDNDNLVAIGRLLVSPIEISSLSRGVVVRVRKGIYSGDTCEPSKQY